MNLTLNEYQSLSAETDGNHPVAYYYLGLSGEAGEVADLQKRVLRGDEDPGDLVKELGDVLWYVSAIARKNNVSLETIAEENLRKLRKRQITGTIKGRGSDR